MEKVQMEVEKGRDGVRAAGQFVTVQGVQLITGKQFLCSLDNCPRHCLQQRRREGVQSAAAKIGEVYL